MMAYIIYEQTKYSLQLVRRLYRSDEILKPRYRLLNDNQQIKYQRIDFNSDDILLELMNSYSLTSWQDCLFGRIEAKHPAIVFGEMQDLPEEIVVPND